MIKILADTSSEFSFEEAKDLNITLVPMHVRFGDEEYLDRFEITNLQFFEKLVVSEYFPETSMVTTEEWKNAFLDATKDNSEVICVTMPKRLSGTYNAAVIASKEFKNVYVVDSGNVTLGEKVVVLRIAELIKKYSTAKEVFDIIEEEKKNVKMICLVDTLEYLRRGGRIGRIASIIGNVFHIKPVVLVDNSKVEVVGKARGSKNGQLMMREKINKFGGIDFNYPEQMGYSGLSDYLIKRYIQDNPDLMKDGTNMKYYLIGSTIGTHAGPGAIALAAFFNGDNNK